MNSKERKIDERNREIYAGLLLNIAVVIIITAMVYLSVVFDDKEIIFPEIAAICIGSFLVPNLLWKTSYARMLIFITLCAICGVLIVIYVPFDKPFQMVIAYMIGQILFLISGTTFAPMISAIVLPVMLGTKSPVYVISAFLLTLTIILIRIATDKMHVTRRRDFKRVVHDKSEESKVFIFRCIVMFALCITGFNFKLNFLAAPPILVLFTELSSPINKGKKNPIRIIGCVFSCSLVGVICRMLICSVLNLPLYVAAFFIGFFMIIVLVRFKVLIPPAGAIAVLALLIDDKFLLTYPVQILIASVIYVLAAIAYGKMFEEIEEKEEI